MSFGYSNLYTFTFTVKLDLGVKNKSQNFDLGINHIIKSEPVYLIQGNSSLFDDRSIGLTV